MAIALIKPGTIRGLVVSAPASEEIGSGGSNFVIKIVEAEYDIHSPAEDVTGDSDEHPTFENNLMLYGDIRFRGVAKAETAIGLYNLVNAAKNPLTVVHTFRLGSGSNEALNFRMFLERVQIAWSYSGAFVGLTITGKMSHMSDAAMQVIQA